MISTENSNTARECDVDIRIPFMKKIQVLKDKMNRSVKEIHESKNEQ